MENTVGCYVNSSLSNVSGTSGEEYQDFRGKATPFYPFHGSKLWMLIKYSDQWALIFTNFCYSRGCFMPCTKRWFGACYRLQPFDKLPVVRNLVGE